MNQFWETYEELSPWAEETLALIAQLPPPAVDHEQLRQQQEEMRVRSMRFSWVKTGYVTSWKTAAIRPAGRVLFTKLIPNQNLFMMKIHVRFSSLFNIN